MRESPPVTKVGNTIQCSSSSRIHLGRNAFQRSFGARLENTSRAPARFAARSCDVRPELSNTITSGRKESIVARTCAVLLVGEASQSMIGKFTDSRNTRVAVHEEPDVCRGLGLGELARDDQAAHQFARAARTGDGREQDAHRACTDGAAQLLVAWAQIPPPPASTAEPRPAPAGMRFPSARPFARG